MVPLVSPDGRYRVVFHEYEMRMSHWVHEPIIQHVDRKNEPPILSFANTLCSAESARWNSASTEVQFEMRKYPGNRRDFVVVVDVLSGRARLEGGLHGDVDFDALMDLLQGY